MTLVLTPEQEEFRGVTRSFLAARSSSAAVRRAMDLADGFDREVWREMAEQLALQGLHIPEEYGGQGFTFVELAVVLEEMGRALLCAPFLSTVALCATALMGCSDDAAKARLLPEIANGRLVATIAHCEPGIGWECETLRTEARRQGDRWLLTGAKTFVLDGMSANALLVTALTDSGASLVDEVSWFEVAGDAPGLTRKPLETMDKTRRQARVELDSVPAKMIAEPGDASGMLARLLDVGAVALAAEQLGAAERVLEMAVEYARDRQQFGRPIGSFQAIKHKCANVLVAVELARSALYAAAQGVVDADPDVSLLASSAKALCSEACTLATAENIQIHGGIGYTWEHDAQLYYKRAIASELMLGDPAAHRERIAARLGV